MKTFKTTRLTYNPGSNTTSDSHRWFESQHKEVKELVEKLEKTINIRMSKSTCLEASRVIEKFLGVEQTPAEEDA